MNKIYLILWSCVVVLAFYASNSKAENKAGFLVHQISENTRVVLSKESCLVPNLKGSRAVVQRLEPTGKASFVRGCWTYDPHNNDNVRIDWEPNPYSKKLKVDNDFAVIEMSRFTYVEE